MSDAIFERIATALETIAKAAGKAAPAAPATGGAGAGANKGAVGAGAGAGAGANKAAPAGGNKGAAGGAGAGASAGANKGAAGGAGKGANPPAAAKAPGGKYNSEQVRDIIRKVATNPSLGKQSALDILDQDGGGVTNVTNLKPENFDKVFEACQALLSSEGGNEQAGAEDEFDPTA